MRLLTDLDNQEESNGRLEDGLYRQNTRGEGMVSLWLALVGGELTCSRAEGKRLTKKAAMTVAAYKVWQEVKAWEEEQAEKRRAEEEDEDSEEGEEEVMKLKERRPRGGRKIGDKENDELDKEGDDMKEEAEGVKVDTA